MGGGRYQRGKGGVYFRRLLPKAERETEKTTKRKGERERRIVLMQRKVVNPGNLGRTTGWIHRVSLFKSGRVHNLMNRVGCTLPCLRR